MNAHGGCNCSQQSNPTAILKAEHRVIERVLDAVERFAAQDRVDSDLFGSALDFLRNFADGCHHAKEENELFPRLEAAGVPREGGPIGCMLDDHAQGRTLIRGMSEHLDAAAAGVPESLQALRAAAAEYVDLLRKHIWKEDHVLFELADQTLTNCVRGAVLEGFDRTEQSDANAGKHERYLRLADELHRRSLELPTGRIAGATA